MGTAMYCHAENLHGGGDAGKFPPTTLARSTKSSNHTKSRPETESSPKSSRQSCQ